MSRQNHSQSLLLLLTIFAILHPLCESFSTPNPSNNNSSNNNASNNSNDRPKYQTTSQKLRQEENLRRLSRVNENVPGKTSAIPNAQNLPLNPVLTQQEWYNSASHSERQMKEITTKALDYLKGLDLDNAKVEFDTVVEMKREMGEEFYCWQYGIVLFYLGYYYEAKEWFGRNAILYERRFGVVASEERIWRDACHLKIISLDPASKKLQNNIIESDRDIDIDAVSEELIKETRKVIRIAKDLFSASVDNDLSNEALARGKLRSICGEYDMGNGNSNDSNSSSNGISNKGMIKVDKKMWRLSSWFYLGLHYDVLGDVDASRDCMKMALRQCATTFGNGDDSKFFHGFIIMICE